MFKIPRMRKQSGSSLIEVMIATSIMAVVALSTAMMINNSQRAMKGIDIKGQVQSVGTQARLNLRNNTSCQTAFRVGTAGVFTLGDAFFPAVGGAPITNALANITIGNITYTTGAGMTDPGGNPIYPDLNVQGINLIIRSPIAPSEYPAIISIRFGRANNNAIGTSTYTAEEIPMHLETQASATVPNSKEIRDCWGETQINMTSMCSQLGGVWLDATLTGKYMPTPRCNLTQDINLAVNENPDVVPDNGTMVTTGPNTGLRVVKCFYSDKTNILRTYNCRTRTGSFTGDVCAFQATQKMWRVIYYKNGAPNKNKLICNRGVLASELSSDSDILEHFEPLSNVTPLNIPTTATEIEKADYLPAVMRCNTGSRGPSWHDCNNKTDYAAKAKMGQGGSCIFVENIKLYTTDSATLDARIADYNIDQVDPPATNTCTTTAVATQNTSGEFELATPCINKSNYTGWIIVNGDTPRTLFTKKGVNYIREARGYPCFQLEVNAASDRPILYGPITSEPSLLPADSQYRTDSDSDKIEDHERNSIPECVHVALRDSKEPTPSKTASTASHRFTILKCNPVDGAYTSINELSIDASFGDKINMGNWDDLENTFSSGTCWYFKDIKVPNYIKNPSDSWLYLTSNFVNTVDTQCPDDNPGSPLDKLAATIITPKPPPFKIPKTQFKVTDQSLDFRDCTTRKQSISAIPCNAFTGSATPAFPGGIRYKK